MKYAKFPAVVFILFFLGYVLGPTINPLLVKEKAPENLRKVSVMLEGGPKPSLRPTPAPGPPSTPNPTLPTPAPVEPVAVAPIPPAPAPAPADGGDLTDDQIVELMKKSIADDTVKEFKAVQIKGWKAAEKETVDGTEYQTGLVAYEATSMFGVNPVQAKALIKGGKVERWVSAKTGMEIQ